ncbi:hypothetical protein Droror1_Dr00000490 [Drosera rotundifolia]
MGGGGDHGHVDGGDFRTKVWSMTGGPYCRPKHWKRNTALAMFGIFLICIPIARKSAELEQRPHLPVRPIPSQLWCKNFGNKDYEMDAQNCTVHCMRQAELLYCFDGLQWYSIR